MCDNQYLANNVQEYNLIPRIALWHFFIFILKYKHMGTLQQIQHWSTTHHPRWLVVLRVILGLCLFIKGISFMNNAVVLNQLISGSIVAKSSDWLPLSITMAHLLGGFLIIIGLLTRW